MKTKEEVQKFIEHVYGLYGAFQELPFWSSKREYGVTIRVKFKPVIYIRPDVMNDLMTVAPDWLTFSFRKEVPTKKYGKILLHAPKLFGLDLYVTNRPDAPEAALALEPIEIIEGENK